MIKIKGLSKFPRMEGVEIIALNKVSLEVKGGEFVTIMGPFGYDKFTLLSILGLLSNPSEGNYHLGDREVGHLEEKKHTQTRKGNIGLVFQGLNLIDELNVFENVELPLTYLEAKTPERKQMVADILKRMSISHHAAYLPRQLSGGQQQHMAIARAVASDPKIVLADEPTGSLDSESGAEVMQLFTELNKEGTMIIVVTHSKHDAGFAHHTVNLFDGSVVSSVNEFIQST